MKKLSLLIVIMVILLVCPTAGIRAASADNLEILSALGILPPDLGEDDTYITRAQMAYMTAKLYSLNDVPLADTVFEDVPMENQYSGYIGKLNTMGIIGGEAPGRFNPEGSITAASAYKMVISALGYDGFAKSWGGYPDGYLKIAGELGFALGIGPVTCGDAKRLVYQALTEPYATITMYTEDGETFLKTERNSEQTLLSERFGISAYKGTIESCTEHAASVRIISNRYKTNPVMLDSGTVYSFNTESVRLEEFRNADVMIWADESLDIKGVVLSAETEIKYGYISSVNNDYQKHAYSIGGMKELTFFEDEEEYEIADGAELWENGLMTEQPVYLTGSFARVVISEDEIKFIETWSLTEGGLIQEADKGEIVYTKGGTQNARLREYDQYEEIRVFINNKREVD